jgi:hypothetical protein
MKINLIIIVESLKQIFHKSGIAQQLARKDKIKKTLAGHPIEYNTQALFLLYCIMVIKKIRSFRSLADFFSNHPMIYRACGLKKSPSHDTLCRRFGKLSYEFQQAIQQMGDLFLQSGLINPRYIAADAKLFWAPESDPQAKFTKGSKGWVRGYSLSVLCIATPNNIPLPLLAKAHSNSILSFKIVASLAKDLPHNVQFVLCDSGYDFSMIYKSIERFDPQNNVIRKALVSPRKGRKLTTERDRRLKFLHSTRGQKIFDRRLPSVELFFARLVKQLGIVRCIFTSKKHNVAYLNLAVLVYQLLIYTNYLLGCNNIIKLKPLLNMI